MGQWSGAISKLLLQWLVYFFAKFASFHYGRLKQCHFDIFSLVISKSVIQINFSRLWFWSTVLVTLEIPGIILTFNNRKMRILPDEKLSDWNFGNRIFKVWSNLLLLVKKSLLIILTYWYQNKPFFRHIKWHPFKMFSRRKMLLEI